MRLRLLMLAHACERDDDSTHQWSIRGGWRMHACERDDDERLGMRLNIRFDRADGELRRQADRRCQVFDNATDELMAPRHAKDELGHLAIRGGSQRSLVTLKMSSVTCRGHPRSLGVRLQSDEGCDQICDWSQRQSSQSDGLSSDHQRFQEELGRYQGDEAIRGHQ